LGSFLKDLSSTLQSSSKVRGRIQFFRIGARIGSEIRFWRGFVVSNRQPLFVVPGTSGDQSQWGEGEVRAVVWAKYADHDD